MSGVCPLFTSCANNDHGIFPVDPDALRLTSHGKSDNLT